MIIAIMKEMMIMNYNEMKVSVKSEPDAFTFITAENEDYKAVISYFDTDYTRARKIGKINPETVKISVTSKKAALPNIKFVLKTKNTKQHIGLDFSEKTFVNENELQKFTENIQIAKNAIENIKKCINAYFPNILQ